MSPVCILQEHDSAFDIRKVLDDNFPSGGQMVQVGDQLIQVDVVSVFLLPKGQLYVLRLGPVLLSHKVQQFLLHSYDRICPP